MANQEEQIRARIATKGICAGDIKHAGRLTNDEIAGLDIVQVFTWIRQCAWSFNDFKKWLKVVKVDNDPRL